MLKTWTHISHTHAHIVICLQHVCEMHEHTCALASNDTQCYMYFRYARIYLMTLCVSVVHLRCAFERLDNLDASELMPSAGTRTYATHSVHKASTHDTLRTIIRSRVSFKCARFGSIVSQKGVLILMELYPGSICQISCNLFPLFIGLWFIQLLVEK